MNKTKLCRKCHTELPKTEFYRESKSKDGLYSYCKKCSYHYKPHPKLLVKYRTEKVCPQCKRLLSVSEYHKDKSNSDGHRSACKKCVRKDLKIYARQHSEEARIRAKENWYKYKRAFLNAYGDKCACCGETEPVFLTIDHINGQAGIKIKDCWTKAYKDAVLKYDPSKYRILCFNCNMAYRFGRTCPHQATV
jgi:hypothetical protein